MSKCKKVRKLYNRYHNLYLDKCYGESKSPLSEWKDFSKYRESHNGRRITLRLPSFLRMGPLSWHPCPK